eukprot:10878693-Lingulodinium_polyedra.AAC.1
MVPRERLHMNRSACAGFHAQPANLHAQPARATRIRNPHAQPARATRANPVPRGGATDPFL